MFGRPIERCDINSGQEIEEIGSRPGIRLGFRIRSGLGLWPRIEPGSRIRVGNRRILGKIKGY